MIAARISNRLERLRELVLGPVHPPSRLYGHDLILRRYAGVRVPYPIPGMLQHGWMLGYGESVGRAPSETEIESPHFVWSRSNLEACREWGVPSVTAIGAPLLYLPPEAAVEERRGALLVFPFHIWERAAFSEDAVPLHQRYLDQLQPLRTVFESITICLYWMQYEQPDIRQVFLNRGLQVTSLGHRDNNPFFLWRFRELVGEYEYVTSNHYSTAIFYALHLGRKAFVYGPPFGMIEGDREVPVAQIQNVMLRRYPQLLWSGFRDTCHAEIAAEELGLEFQRSPGQLRELFEWGLMPLMHRLGGRARRRFRG